MRKSQKRTLDDLDFIVTPFSATEGLGCLLSLTKLLGAPLGKAAGSVAGEGNLLDVDTENVTMGVLADAIGSLADRLHEQEVMSLIKRLLMGTHVVYNGKTVELMAGGNEAPFEVVFQGKYFTLFKLLGFVLEVNFDLPLAGLTASLVQTEADSDPE